MSDRPYTVKEVADLLRVSTWTVAAMTRDGRLPKIAGIRYIRIPSGAVLRLLEGGYSDPRGEPDRQASTRANGLVMAQHTCHDGCPPAILRSVAITARPSAPGTRLNEGAPIDASPNRVPC